MMVALAGTAGCATSMEIEPEPVQTFYSDTLADELNNEWGKRLRALEAREAALLAEVTRTMAGRAEPVTAEMIQVAHEVGEIFGRRTILAQFLDAGLDYATAPVWLSKRSRWLMNHGRRISDIQLNSEIKQSIYDHDTNVVKLDTIRGALLELADISDEVNMHAKQLASETETRIALELMEHDIRMRIIDSRADTLNMLLEQNRLRFEALRR